MVETQKRNLHFRNLLCESSLQLANSGSEQGDEGMAPDKDGSCLYCSNLPFYQEITQAYVLVQQHQLRWFCGLLFPSKPWKAWRMMMWVQTTLISWTTSYDNTYFSLCPLSIQPAMSVSTKQCQVLTMWDSIYFLCIRLFYRWFRIFIQKIT